MGALQSNLVGTPVIVAEPENVTGEAAAVDVDVNVDVPLIELVSPPWWSSASMPPLKSINSRKKVD